MFFLNTTFLGLYHTADVNPVDLANVNKITLSLGIFDKIFATKDVSRPFPSSIPSIWDLKTILLGEFKGDLMIGNASFTVDTITSLRIKRREKDTYNWITMFEFPIDKEEDFEITCYDKFARSNVEYEYALVPVLNNVEGAYNPVSIMSKFNGLYIVDKDTAYSTILNTQYPNPTRKRESSKVATMGSKHPFTINKSKQNYYEGEVEGTFIQMNEDKELTESDFEMGWRYRDGMKDWLFDGNLKVLKYDDGRMFLIAITDDITDTSNHRLNTVTRFSWNESGNVDSSKDLYEAGLIDVYMDGE